MEFTWQAHSYVIYLVQGKQQRPNRPTTSYACEDLTQPFLFAFMKPSTTYKNNKLPCNQIIGAPLWLTKMKPQQILSVAQIF